MKTIEDIIEEINERPISFTKSYIHSTDAILILAKEIKELKQELINIKGRTYGGH